MSVTAAVAAALSAAAIPVSKVGPARHARLDDPQRDLYFWILRDFASTGRPSRTETREAAKRLGLPLDEALRTLAVEDLVHTDRDGEIVVAYPFSGRPTEHRVRFPSGHEVHAMCAIDALGIAPMFDEPIEIATRDPRTGERLVVRLDPDGTGTWQPEEAVVVCGASDGGGDSCLRCCPALNFFASAESGEAWLVARPEVRGYVLTMPEAIEVGRAVFGNVLKPARARDTLVS